MTTQRKGIIFTGGSPNQLRADTLAICKQLLLMYANYMAHYPLSTGVLAWILFILLISTPQDSPRLQQLLGNGSQWGLNLQYGVQASLDGLAKTFIVKNQFVGHSPNVQVRGDNIFHDNDFMPLLDNADAHTAGANVFACHVTDHERLGIDDFSEWDKAGCVEAKIQVCNSNDAILDLCFYYQQLVDVAKSLRLSARGELKFTTVDEIYLQNRQLNVRIRNRTYAGLDTSLHYNPLGGFILNRRQCLTVACVEEIAWCNGLINSERLEFKDQNLAENA